MSSNLVVIVIALLTLFHPMLAINVAKQVDSNVLLVGKGDTELVIPNELSFALPKSCQGLLLLCYAAERTVTSDGQQKLENVNTNCPVGYCMITLDSQSSAPSTFLKQELQQDNIVATFDKSQAGVCPLKTINNRQSFTVIELPKCDVIVNDASLPTVATTTENHKGKQTSMENNVDEKENKKFNWPLVLVGCIIISLFGIAAFTGLVYMVHRDFKKNEPKPNHQSRRQKPAKAVSPSVPSPSVPPTSPSVAPTSPATIPTISPSTTKTPARSPAVVETPKQEAEPKAPQAAPEKKPVILVTPKSIVKVPEISPNEMVEDAPHSLYRNKLLLLNGSPQEVRDQLKAIVKKYSTRPYRQTTVKEQEFFLTFVSDAYRDATPALKDARKALCEHGAIYEFGNWRFFNAITQHYISRPSTPGFTAWYAFAGEYGNDIKFTSEAHAQAVLEKLSAPALLTVYFREDQTDQVRRSAYAHLRRQFTPIFKNFTEKQLHALPYPICLFPDLHKKNPKLFEDAANDKTYSTPVDWINQRIKDEATVEEKRTDETQASFSDGQMPLRSASVEVLGSRTSATTTIKME